MKILTLGNGFIANHLPYQKITDRIAINPNQVRNILEAHKPDILINAIGYAGKVNVDSCEDEKYRTYTSNVVVPAILADECNKLGIRIITIGSGCIFYGSSPNLKWKSSPPSLYDIRSDAGWKEEDVANCKSYYSCTKYSCDLLLGSLPNVLTLRIRMPVSSQKSPRNLITKLKGYNKIIDIPNSVTFVSDLVKCIDFFTKTDYSGIYHVTNPEKLTAVDVMKEYQKYDPSYQFEVISESQLDQITKAKRSNCYLNTDKLQATGFTMTPSWEALKICMEQYFKN